MSNPYTLTFGQPPLEAIERRPQAEKILSDFTQERPSNSINLVTGLRGSGKTVFITNIAKRIEASDGWVVIDLNPQTDLLQSAAAKLYSSAKLSKIFDSAEINLSLFGIGANIKGSHPISDIEEALIRMLTELKNKKKKVLFTVDEACNSKNMRIFASSFQIFLRKELPVFLIMTGLYKDIDALRNAKGMTFLERAPRTMLNPLSVPAIAAKYIDTLRLKQDAAHRIAATTKGYAFAFQTIGYYLWEEKNKEDKALAEAKEYLFEMAYQKIWSELSQIDREVCRAIASSERGEVFDIRGRLNYTSDQFNPYSNRLKKAGVAVSPKDGELEFALPWFEEFTQLY